MSGFGMGRATMLAYGLRRRGEHGYAEWYNFTDDEWEAYSSDGDVVCVWNLTRDPARIKAAGFPCPGVELVPFDVIESTKGVAPDMTRWIYSGEGGV